MTVEVAPGFIQADTYSAEILRRVIGAGYQRGASIGSNVGGLVGATDCLITPQGSNRKINIAPGEVWVPGTTALQGMYYFRVSATEVLECAAEEANPRMDRIVARVYDSAYGGTANLGKLEIIKGTANVSAAFPGATSAGVAAQPENSYTLGYVLVPKATKEPLEAKDIENSATLVSPISGAGPWTPLTLGAKVEQQAGAETVRCRWENGKATVRLRGTLAVKAGQEVKAADVFATLPAEYRPAATLVTSIFANGIGATRLTITSAGEMSLPQATIVFVPAAGVIGLDGLTFSIT